MIKDQEEDQRRDGQLYWGKAQKNQCIMKTTGRQTVTLSDIVEDSEQWRESLASGICGWKQLNDEDLT